MPNSPNRPAFSAAARTRSTSGAVRSAAKNGRPVLVQIAPAAPGTPNLGCASSSERQTSSTAREPMCFSSHSTDSTPSAR